MLLTFGFYLVKECIVIVESTTYILFGTKHWIGLGVLIFFFAGAVFRWIICGGVSTHAISVGFHKNRAFAATSMVYGVIHNGCGSKWIITIHSKPFKPVALCAFI